MGGLEKCVVVRQILHLCGCGLSQFISAVANVYTPQTSHGVEKTVAIGVPQINAFRPSDNAGADAVHLGMVGEGMNVVCMIQLAPALRIHRLGLCAHRQLSLIIPVLVNSLSTDFPIRIHTNSVVRYIKRLTISVHVPTS